MQSKVGFVTFEWVHGKTNIGSTRIRVKWLLKHWQEAEEFKVGRKYDVMIFQKAYLIELAELYDGVKILDICDPDWLEGTSIIKMINRCDAVTTSSPALQEEISRWTDKPVVHIPDRIDFDFCKQKKIHKGKAKSVVWFGYSHNAHALKHVFPYLKKLGLSLTVISDKPYETRPKYDYEVNWVKYETDKFNDEIIKHDIVLFPPSFKYKDRYKSNNKTVHSWALGMPVAHTYEDLEKFMTEKGRKEESDKRLKEVKSDYDVKLSVKEYKELIDRIKESHSNPGGGDSRC